MKEKMNGALKRISKWFRSCYGADQLGLTIVLAALAFSILDRIIRTDILTILAMFLYMTAVVRMFSHNRTKRENENSRFIGWRQRVGIGIKQSCIRIVNMRKYKYYKCPNCRSILRMPRGIGEKTVICPHCRHMFRQTA